MYNCKSRVGFNPPLSAAYDLVSDNGVKNTIKLVNSYIKNYLQNKNNTGGIPPLRSIHSMLNQVYSDIENLEFISFTNKFLCAIEQIDLDLNTVIISITHLILCYGSDLRIWDMPVKTMLDLLLNAKEQFLKHVTTNENQLAHKTPNLTSTINYQLSINQ